MSQAETFAALQKVEGNNKCFECGVADPQWISVNNGIYICLECSGRHRGLGVNLSFVRSITMDILKESEINSMRLAGNKKVKAWLETNGTMYDYDPDLDLAYKWSTRAAYLHRDHLKHLVFGEPWDIETSAAQNIPLYDRVRIERHEAEKKRMEEERQQLASNPHAHSHYQSHEENELDYVVGRLNDSIDYTKSLFNNYVLPWSAKAVEDIKTHANNIQENESLKTTVHETKTKLNSWYSGFSASLSGALSDIQNSLQSQHPPSMGGASSTSSHNAHAHAGHNESHMDNKISTAASKRPMSHPAFKPTNDIRVDNDELSALDKELEAINLGSSAPSDTQSHLQSSSQEHL